ncbi:uncharacterized protein K02A2.6-like [Dermacentor silvarum]|uniref:uncharacterized protein K02A2.6-like n=1 Tax=Dermacentor silvarum TaxID=543639 RepID=UPI0021014B08|nr:uncharacterized protein K02A2.6-like [Dermacentor silvarum]
MLGTRVVVPAKLQGFVLDELHDGHPGIVRSKELARSYVWWPTLEADLELRIRSCASCQEQRNAPTKAPLHPWSWPTSPWQRVHIDFAGPFQNTMLLVVVDAHSKWPEVFEMRSTTTESTIRCLTELFARFGFPETIVSDNGPQFASQEFKHFVQAIGARHVLTAPYHPSSNGLAERFIQTLKNAPRKDGTGETLQYVQPPRGAPSPGVATRISCYRGLQRTLPLCMEQLVKLRPASSWFFPRLTTHQFLQVHNRPG